MVLMLWRPHGMLRRVDSIGAAYVPFLVARVVLLFGEPLAFVNRRPARLSFWSTGLLCYIFGFLSTISLEFRSSVGYHPLSSMPTNITRL